MEQALEDEEEDRISALPDCLIVQILSLLPKTKHAITTGTLSKRWKSLWTLTPTFIFERYDFVRPISDFVSIINETLTQFRHSKLNKFKITTGYDIRFEAQVNSWIRYAISRKAEELDLSLCAYRYNDKCLLEEQFFINSCFTDLRLDGFVFDPNGTISWKMLRRLSMYNANVDEHLIENILVGSPVLETLELRHCYGYRRLDITSKSVKDLILWGYRYQYFHVIEINAPNILSLQIQNYLYLWRLLLLDVSSLVEAKVNYTKHGYYKKSHKKDEEKMLEELIQPLHHVKELKVGRRCLKVLFRLKAKGFPFPVNMKFSKATPRLHSECDSSDEDDSSDSA